MTKSKIALITGITGQDGSYLSELLLSKDYEVHGLVRRNSTFNTDRIDHIYDDLNLHYGDLTDGGYLHKLINEISPHEIYHLGAQSHVRVSFDIPQYTTNVDALGTTRLLEACKGKNIKIYNASSSEMFGDTPPPQNEKSRFSPKSPYACSKLYAYFMCRNYRDGYGMFITNGLLFNHESERRGKTFVTRKITDGISMILSRKKQKLYLGNLDAERDWGYAPEFVEGIYKLMQLDKPCDCVLGTGIKYKVRDFLNKVYEYIDKDMDSSIVIDSRFFRPTETNTLLADYSLAKRLIGWKPKIKFDDLVKIMMDYSMKSEGLEVIGEGFDILEKKFPNRWWC